MSTDTRRLAPMPEATSGHPRPSLRALGDLALVAVVVWLAAVAIHAFDIPAALEAWNRSHEQWAIDEVTLVSLVAVGGLGVFSWRRWQESLRALARHQATLQRLHTSETEIAAKDQLIRTVSHELRTPLTAILGYAEMLRDPDSRGGEREAMIGTILRQGRDLSDIVEDLLTRAQSEARTLRVVAVPVSLVANVNQVLEGWNPDERPRIVAAGTPASAVGDPARVRQVLRNLLTNAFRYGAGTVVITTGVTGAHAWVTVSDGGRGIPVGEEDRVFEPYHRAGGTPGVVGSLGLGLAISRELARLMGGDLTYRRDGGRTVFELRLPRNPRAGDQVL